VPSAAETAATLIRARRALAEIELRSLTDRTRETERSAQLTRWHVADRDAAQDQTRTLERN
jgi:hypothetical protein